MQYKCLPFFGEIEGANGYIKLVSVTTSTEIRDYLSIYNPFLVPTKACGLIKARDKNRVSIS